MRMHVYKFEHLPPQPAPALQADFPGSQRRVRPAPAPPQLCMCTPRLARTRRTPNQLARRADNQLPLCAMSLYKLNWPGHVNHGRPVNCPPVCLPDVWLYDHSCTPTAPSLGARQPSL